MFLLPRCAAPLLLLLLSACAAAPPRTAQSPDWLQHQSLLAGMREYPELYEKVVVERNRRWSGQIEKMLAEGGGDMVVVGAAHLVGKDSLVEMLKAKGYRVEQR